MFKLVKLSANKESFHEVVFKDGLNVVLGQSKLKKKSGKKKTTNGIGKSLIIKIIDFCLGSNKNTNWEIPLKDWIFTLVVSIDGEEYAISRAINNQKIIVVNGEEKPINKFGEYIKELLAFSADFSFRQIINRFLRKGKNAYLNYLTTVSGEKECNTLLIVCYLLGFDYKYCTQKIQLKKDLDTNKELLSKTQKDSNFRELFGIGNFDLDLELGSISFEIEEVEKEIHNKNFAENYADIQAEANRISSILDNLNNGKFVIENNIAVINQALNREITVEVQDVQNVYADASVVFSDQLKHSLEEVVGFHKQLLMSRKETLKKELLTLQKELTRVANSIEENNKKFDEYLSFLESHSAMDKYVVAIRKLDALKTKQKELNKIATIEKTIKTKIEKTNQELSTSNINAQTYLDSIETKREAINKQFVNLAKTLYVDKKSALVVKVNTGVNQVRFNIDARITSDGSDGINEMITFCFDWVLLLQGITKQGFIYHDSLLFANTEIRQREILFSMIESLCGADRQYIINVNEDQIEGFDELTRKIIDNNVILTLTDESVQSKLLGIEVDLGRDIDDEKPKEK